MASDLLDTYLSDHYAGSTAGLELARRIADAHPGNRELAHITTEIEEDRDTLRVVMSSVEVDPSTLKLALGWLGEKAGRLKLNDRVFGRSPLASVLELEGLIAGVTGKLQLWRAMVPIAARDSRLAGFDFVALARRAESQRERLESEQRRAVEGTLA